MNNTARSEVLPGHRPNSSLYHDMKGYYYIFNALKENKRYVNMMLLCILIAYNVIII